MNYFSAKDSNKIKEKAIVLHVHGGGFVSMSSGSHQTYTRMWA
jgi:hormone-sensitive lipase